MRNFHMLIVSAVKFCQECLQAVFASRGLRPQNPYRGDSPLDSIGDFRLQTP